MKPRHTVLKKTVTDALAIAAKPYKEL
jgi:hypothetical protein